MHLTLCPYCTSRREDAQASAGGQLFLLAATSAILDSGNDKELCAMRKETIERVFADAAKKAPKTEVFDAFLELLGGFETPTSSLPSDKNPSSRWYIRLCGHFCRKKDEVENSLLHVLHPFISPCGSKRL